MNHTLERLASYWMSSDSDHRIERAIQFFEGSVAYCVLTLGAHLIETQPYAVECMRNFYKIGAGGSGGVAFGSSIGLLRQLLKNKDESRYQQYLRTAFKSHEYGPNDSLPLKDLTVTLAEKLGKPAPRSKVSLLTFLSVMVEFRNSLSHPPYVPGETARSILDDLECAGFPKAFLEAHSGLSRFPLGFVRNQPDPGAPTEIVFCEGLEPLGVNKKSFSIDAQLMKRQVYLFEDDPSNGMCRVLASVSPFILVEQGQTAEDYLYFLTGVREKKDTIQRSYSNLIDAFELKQNDDSSDSLILSRLTDGDSRSQHSTEPNEVDEREDVSTPYVEPADYAHIRIETRPRMPNVQIRVCRDDDAKEGIATESTRHDGTSPQIPVCPGPCVVQAEFTSKERNQETTIRAKRDLGKIGAKSNQTIFFHLPFSINYSDEVIQSLERRHRWIQKFRKRWPILIYGMVGAVLLFFVVMAILYTTSAPEGLVYVPPLPKDECFEVGLVKSNRNVKPADQLVAIISDLTFDTERHKDLLIRTLDQTPRKRHLNPYYMERHEVSVKRYAGFMASLTNEKRELYRPDEWEIQLRDSLKGGALPLTWKENKEDSLIFKDKDTWLLPPYPVYGVNYVQVQGFCDYLNGKLKHNIARPPTSDEWEVAARNLLPGDQNYWTVYPWGNMFFPGETTTIDSSPSRSAPLRKTNEKAKKREIYDLGGNLSEWTSTKDESGQYAIRGGAWCDDGITISMGLGIWFRAENTYKMSDDDIGIRIVYSERPGNVIAAEIEGIEGGIYTLGRPDTPIFELLADLENDAQFILPRPDSDETVGNFLVMRKKVSQGQYRKFLSSSRNEEVLWEKKHSGQSLDDRLKGKENDPVLGLTWHEAFAYCLWRGGRLPTAVEWERIARGAHDSPGNLLPWGHYTSRDKAKKDLKDFLAEAKNPDKASILHSMWSFGPEWTSTDSQGEKKEDVYRILKGLPPEEGIPYASGRISNRGGHHAYITTARYPAQVDLKIYNAGCRCVFDIKPSLFDNVGLTAAFKTKSKLEEKKELSQ